MILDIDGDGIVSIHEMNEMMLIWGHSADDISGVLAMISTEGWTFHDYTNIMKNFVPY